MNFQAPSKRPRKMSPLWTSLTARLSKAALLGRLGKDSDGAFRAYRRIDGLV